MSQLLPYEVEGNQNSSNMVIFIHGWPDNICIWDETVKNLDLKNSYILKLSYPNYHKQQESKFGLNFKQVVEKMRNTIEKVDDGKNYKKVLVGHDWGAYVSYLYDATYPKTIDQLICLDISPYIQKSFLAVAFTIFYQWWNIWAFVIGLIYKPFGNILTKLLILTLFAKYPYDKERINCTMGYFYLYLWIDLFKNIFLRQKRALAGYKPSVPFTYIFAKDKPFQFHNDRWLQFVQKNSNNELHMVKGKTKDTIDNSSISNITDVTYDSYQDIADLYMTKDSELSSNHDNSYSQLFSQNSFDFSQQYS
ncbi:hypothetical protein PPERSA_06689 [Pseudocohnilembus persalinus]|uniref:AB hydrolase-1 domain-containing protein n=1 Tax=Pseudocohnilembus persalinus TaxID=266149 RepID=A0A0V0QRW9_PSEPJ|nr:hypothetical protein PPERSA_06689 [Pseudocohnilembus persalinus]|eukprot:KRX05055.1 hypothetical protein PPERSA_06689 [Pseudocohnilembus persalinus]